MGSTIPKQFLLLQGKPVLWHTLNTFLSTFPDIKIVLVLPSAFLDMGDAIAKTLLTPASITITPGGDTRFQSVKNGLQLVAPESVIFVHDAVRCLVSRDLIQRCYDTAIEKGNAIPATSSIDSVRIETNGNNKIVDRNQVRIIQTPQTFLSKYLLPAFEQPYDPSFTDEASVVEKNGSLINLVEGEYNNIKITHPADLAIAASILESRVHN